MDRPELSSPPSADMELGSQLNMNTCEHLTDLTCKAKTYEPCAVLLLLEIAGAVRTCRYLSPCRRLQCAARISQLRPQSGSRTLRRKESFEKR